MSSKKMVPSAAAVVAMCVAVVCSVQAQDATRGKILFFGTCAGCHGLEPRTDDQAPSLGGVIGRRAGTVPDFHYSSAMLSANFVWDESRLKAFLADPQVIVPGNRMPFSVADSDVRADIVAYLKTLQ
jgi:cytochrome c2